MHKYSQGHFHRTCSIFSVINAISFLDNENKLSKNDFQDMFDHILEKLDEEEVLTDIMLQGANSEELNIIINIAKEYLSEKYALDLKFNRLFWNEKLSWAEMIEQIKCYELLLVRIKKIKGKKQFDHYSLIENIDDKYLYFYDSDGLTKIRNEQISLKQDKTYQIPLRQIYSINLVKIECNQNLHPKHCQK